MVNALIASVPDPQARLVMLEPWRAGLRVFETFLRFGGRASNQAAAVMSQGVQSPNDDHAPKRGFDMTISSSLLINVNEILSFFDERPYWADRHSAAVVAMIFEDLAAAALEHCLLANDAKKVTVRRDPVTTGQKKGPRLDRWIEADLTNGRQVIFQTEIKSLSAHSTGHQTISLDATGDQLRAHEQMNWELLWNSETNTLTDERIAKVLIPMKRPDGTGTRQLLPLLIFWHPVGPIDRSHREDQVQGGHLFKVTNVTYDFGFRKPHSWKINCKFNQLWVFSISSYLRSIRDKGCGSLELPMPIASEKMRALERVAQVPSNKR